MDSSVSLQRRSDLAKDANRSTRIDAGPGDGGHSEQKQAPQPPRPGKGHRVRPGSSEQHDNQRELGVGPDHMTDAMRRDKRGTFP
jgi:hypothetical protein